MNKLKWKSGKLKFTNDCILITAHWLSFPSEPCWEYNFWEVKKVDGYGEDGQPSLYWGLFEQDGEEWGDISELNCDFYAIIEPRKNLPKKRKLKTT